MRTKTDPAAALTIVRASNYFPIHDGWVWRECLVQLADGSTAVYDVPQYRLGGAR